MRPSVSNLEEAGEEGRRGIWVVGGGVGERIKAMEHHVQMH